MREYLFRGKTIMEDKWVYGSLVNIPHFRGYIQIIDNNNVTHLVLPETVGQWTFVLAFDGQKIFEGDIVTVYYSPFAESKMSDYKGFVKWISAEWGMTMYPFDNSGACFSCSLADEHIDEDGNSQWQILGNLWDTDWRNLNASTSNY